MKIIKPLYTENLIFFTRTILVREKEISSKTSYYSFYKLEDVIQNETDFYSLFPEESSKMSQLTNEVFEVFDEIIESEDLYFETYELLTEMNGCWSKEDKIDLLKQTLKELWKQEDLTILFLTYMNKHDKIHEKQSWKELTQDIFIVTPRFLMSYLKGDLVGYENSKDIKEEGIDELILEWIYFSKIKNLIHFCENHLSELENRNITTNSNLDTSKKILLLEEIISDNNWSDYSASKKGKVVSKLIDKNFDNVKKFYAEIHKKPSESKKMMTDKFKEDKTEVKELYKKLLG